MFYVLYKSEGVNGMKRTLGVDLGALVLDLLFTIIIVTCAWTKTNQPYKVVVLDRGVVVSVVVVLLFTTDIIIQAVRFHLGVTKITNCLTYWMLELLRVIVVTAVWFLLGRGLNIAIVMIVFEVFIRVAIRLLWWVMDGLRSTSNEQVKGE